MEQRTNVRTLFVGLPIRDVARSRAFWTKLGFQFNEQFSDDKGLCLILKEGSAYAMLITREFFETFTNRPASDGQSTQVLLSIDVGSREKVDEVVKIALDNGATRYMDAVDHGWMYYDRFADPDGHQWEITFIDESKVPTDYEGNA